MTIQLPQPLQLDLKSLTGSLISHLNTFSRETIAAITGVYNRQEVLEADYLGGSGILRLRPSRVRGRPKAVCNGGVWIAETGSGVTGVTLAWRWEDPDVLVDSIAGLSAGVRYRLALLVAVD